MSTSFKTSMFGGFDRSDVIAYIEKTGREHEERVAALEAENETLRKENQTLENTQRVTHGAAAEYAGQRGDLPPSAPAAGGCGGPESGAGAALRPTEGTGGRIRVSEGPCGPDRDQRPPPHGAVPGGGRDPAASAGGPAAGVVPHGAGGL